MNIHKPVNLLIAPITAGLILIPFSGLTFANQEGTQESSIERITVQGSKRNTDLMESDLSITVIGAELIDQARLRDFSRIDDLAPNVQFNEAGQRGSIYITIRGVESNPFIVNRAAVYIDGIPFRELNNSVLNQIESIEVLRGPQGTLYGANSESGLIIVNTKQPTEHIERNFRLTAKQYPSGHGYESSGFVSGTLMEDTLTGSLAFSSAYEDAYVENLASSTSDSGHVRDNFLQGRLTWQPTDKISVKTTTYYLDSDAPGIFDQQYAPLNVELYNQFYADFFNGGVKLDDWSILEDAPKYTTEEELVAGVSANYQLNRGTIDFAASYRTLEEDAKGLDFDLTAMPVVSGREIKSRSFKNMELRYTSPSSDTFDYIIGVAYYAESEDNTKATFIGTGNLDSYLSAPVQYKDGEDSSIFGSLNWYLSPKFKLGAGLRYDNAKRNAVQTAGELDLGLGIVTTYQDADLSKSFDAWLPRLSVLYQIHENFSVHASVSKGYIPGGFNLTAVQEGVVDDSVLTYDSETLVSQEIGFKWQANNNKLRMSGAIFNINSDNWQEIQIATDAYGRPISSDYISSNASIKSRGIEFEMSWHPIDPFSINAHLGVVDAEYDNLQLTESLNVKGQSIQFVPDYDAGISIHYEWDNNLYARAEVGFIGETALRSRGDAIQDAVTTLNMQLGYDNGKYAIRLFGENLTNERRASGLAIENLAFGSDGLFYGPLDAPRVVGIEAEVWL